jgi:hypothetical protein
MSPVTLPTILKYQKSTSAPMHDAWFWKTINAIFLIFKIVELGHILTTMGHPKHAKHPKIQQ